MAKSERPIIIKRIIVAGGGHHGGAWKVAYADFVTAMMAFFLLLWLLGSTTEDQRKSLADYFSPSPAVSSSNSGSGGLLGGVTISVPGSLSSPNAAFTSQEAAPNTLVKPTENDGDSQRCRRGRAGRGQRPGKRPRPASGRRSAQARRSPVPDAGAARKAPVRQGGRGAQAGAGDLPRPPGPQEQPAGRSDARRHARADRR